jgi:DNA-binding MarR family transcriptional regulator
MEAVLLQLQGTHTIKSVMTLLGVDKKKAIYYIHRLRKQGFVTTTKKSNQQRIYTISPLRKGTSYYDILNTYSPFQLVPVADVIVHGTQPGAEETLVFAITTKDIRTILASLALFRKITDWSLLYKLAKKHDLKQEIGALYDLSKTRMRVRKMPRRFSTYALPKTRTYTHLIKGLQSDHFKSIEQKWKVRLPFNTQDLEGYQ